MNVAQLQSLRDRCQAAADSGQVSTRVLISDLTDLLDEVIGTRTALVTALAEATGMVNPPTDMAMLRQLLDEERVMTRRVTLHLADMLDRVQLFLPKDSEWRPRIQAVVAEVRSA